MGGVTETIEARTITELEKMVRERLLGYRGQGLEDIRLRWDRDRVEETKDGYRIKISAHT